MPVSHAQYLSDLLEIVATAQRIIEERLEPVFALMEARADSSHMDADPELERKLREAMDRVRLKLHEALPAPMNTARKMTRQVEIAQRRAMNAQFKEVAAIDLFDQTQSIAPVLRASVRRNVALIESIPEELHGQVNEVVTQGIAAGSRVETIRNSVQERFGVAKSRAELIARDQVGKLSGELAKTRQEDLGIDEYTWSCSNDERVRGRPGGKYANSAGNHWVLNDTVQKWSDPPIVDEEDGRRAHPGEDYQCRCQALPRVAALLDALGVPDEDAEFTPAENVEAPRNAVQEIRARQAEPLQTELELQSRAPLLAGARVAAEGVSVDQIDYIQTGMRDLTQHTSAYAGLSQRAINEVATGLRKTSQGKLFEPIKLESDLVPSVAAQGKKLALIDGRHRLTAALAAGAKYILVEVDGQRVIMPLL